MIETFVVETAVLWMFGGLKENHEQHQAEEAHEVSSGFVEPTLKKAPCQAFYLRTPSVTAVNLQRMLCRAFCSGNSELYEAILDALL